MCVLHGCTDRSEKFETFGNRESLGIAILVDGCAVDEFHDQVRHFIDGCFAVEQSGDVGMIEVGKDLAFMSETFLHELVIKVATNQLDGNLVLELAIDAGGPIHLSHPAMTDFLKDVVGSYPTANPTDPKRR